MKDIFDGLPVGPAPRWWHWLFLWTFGRRIVYISEHVYDVADRSGRVHSSHRQTCRIETWKLRGVLYITKMEHKPIGS